MGELFTSWLGSLPGAAVLVVTGLALVVEAGLLVGLAVPGTTILLVLGVLTHMGVIPLAATLSTAVIATAIGAQLGFWRGRTAKLPKHRIIERVTGLVGKHRGWAVAIGHWSSAGRNLVPRIAASDGMPYRRFALAVLPSAALWAGTIVLIGYTQAAAFQRWSDTLGVVGPSVAVVLVAALIVSGRIARRRAVSPRPVRQDPSPVR